MNLIDKLMISIMFMALVVRPISDYEMMVFSFGFIVIFVIWNAMDYIMYHWKRD